MNLNGTWKLYYYENGSVTANTPAELAAAKGMVDSVVSTASVTSESIAMYVRAMQNSGGSGVVTLHHLVDGQADALEFNVTESCRNLGKTLMEIRLKPNILIACINRMGSIIIPGGADTLEKGDTVVVITTSNRVVLDMNDIFADEG